MSSSRIGGIAAVLGGLVWIAAAVKGWSGDVDATVFLAGEALFVVALAAGGYALVATAPVWLRLIVMVATPCLGYMVWITVHEAFPTDHVPVLVVGVLMVTAGLIGMGHSRSHTRPAPVRGRRAAR